MIDIKENKFYLIIFISAIVFWALALYFGQFIEKNYKSVSIRYEEESVSINDINDIERKAEKNAFQDEPYITLWDKIENKTLENKKHGKKLNAVVFEFYGNMATVNSNEFIHGGYPFRDNTEGCVLDEKAAYSLFGDSNIIGNKIEYNFEEYIVCGVIKGNENVAMIQQNKEDEKFTFMEFELQNTENGEIYSKNYIFEKNLPQKYGIIDGYFLGDVSKFLYFLPSYILLFIASWGLLKNTWNRRNFKYLFFISIIITAILIVILFIVSGFSIKFPERFVPTKWSNFDFWSNTYNEIYENIKFINRILPLEKDIVLKRNLLFCTLSSFISSILFLIYFKTKKNMNYNTVLAFAFIMSSFSTSLIFVFGISAPICYNIMPMCVLIIDSQKLEKLFFK